MSAKARRRTRKPPRRLSAAELAEIDELIELDRGGTDEQREEERQNLLRLDREKLNELVRASPTTPWPKQVGPGPTSGRDGFLYVREADGLTEAQRAHVVEVARRDGLIRYAPAPGDPGIDLDQCWRERDPSWHFITARLRDVHPGDIDRVIDEAVDDLLDSNIPLSQITKRFIKAEEFSAAGVFQQTVTSGRALLKLPKLLADFLVTTSRGETRVEIASQHIVTELRKIQHIGKGFVFAILVAGAGLAAVVLRINHFYHESVWAAGICGTLFFWLLVVLRKK